MHLFGGRCPHPDAIIFHFGRFLSLRAGPDRHKKPGEHPLFDAAPGGFELGIYEIIRL
jgi:hypothetical protein